MPKPTLSAFTLALILCASAPTAQTALDLPGLTEADTRFGTLTIIKTDIDGYDGKQLAFNRQPVAKIADAYVAIEAVLPAVDADYALISVANGGNGCPTSFAFVRTDANGVKASEVFGTCSEGVLDLRLTDTGIAADIASFDPAVEYETFTWDGRSFTTAKLYRTNDGASAAGAADDVTRWLGRYPPEPFADASERLRFGLIMSEDQVYELATRVTVGSENIESEGFVVGEGFDPTSGGDLAAIWGIRIADGAPFAVFRTTSEAPQFFGIAAEDLPSRVDDFLKAQ
ncbi:MAG: hypothetical protein ABI459_11805 [Deltaproteobacteria bacterium]